MAHIYTVATVRFVTDTPKPQKIRKHN